jgi:hypothetical protein
VANHLTKEVAGAGDCQTVVVVVGVECKTVVEAGVLRVRLVLAI